MLRVLAIHHRDSRDTGLFGARARAAGVAVDEWCPADGGPPPADPARYDGLLVLGGGVNLEDAADEPYLVDELALVGDHLRSGRPVLGICLGAQMLAAAAGAAVRRAARPEIGWLEVRTRPAAASDPVFARLPERFAAYQWHAFSFELPAGAVALAESDVCPQAFRVGERAWGLQFHPEVTEAMLLGWFEDYPGDPDVVRAGITLEGARAELPERLGEWTPLGERLFDGWLEGAGLAAAAGRRAA